MNHGWDISTLNSQQYDIRATVMAPKIVGIHLKIVNELLEATIMNLGIPHWILPKQTSLHFTYNQ